MKTYFFSIISFLFLTACNKPIEGTTISVSVDIHYTTASNENLFPNPARGFIQDSVRLFVMRNGVKKMVDVSSPGVDLSFPRNYFISIMGERIALKYSRIIMWLMILLQLILD